MDKLVQQAIKTDLTDTNIKKIAPNAKVMLYEDLEHCDDIFDAIGKTNCMALLFPIENDSTGHWIMVLYHPDMKLIEHFDSYGLSPVQELGYTQNQYVKEKLLNNLYKKAVFDGYRVVYNETRLQVMKQGVNDCGRYVACRAIFQHLTNQKFCKLFIGQKLSPDTLVTLLTLLMI